VRQNLDKVGFIPVGNTPAEFLSDTKAEAKVWSETISRGKLALD
jgi:hypothetical protein